MIETNFQTILYFHPTEVIWLVTLLYYVITYGVPILLFVVAPLVIYFWLGKSKEDTTDHKLQNHNN